MYVGVGCFVSRQLRDGSTVELGGVKHPILSDWQPYSYHVRFCQSLSHNSPTLANLPAQKSSPTAAKACVQALVTTAPLNG